VLCFCLYLISSQGLSQTGSPKDIPISEFAALPKNTGVRISPDGTKFLILSKHQGKTIVVVKPLTAHDDWPGIALPAPKDMDIRWARWGNDDYVLLSLGFENERNSLSGKQVETRLISIPVMKPKKSKNMAKMPVDRGSMFRLRGTADHDKNPQQYVAPVQDYIVDILPDDPKHFLLAIDDDQLDWGWEVRRVNITSGQYKLIHDPGEEYSRWITDQQGNIRFGYGRRLAGTSLSEVKDIASYRDPDSSNWKDYSNEDFADREKFIVSGFYQDPRFAFVFARNNYGFWALYKFNMQTLERVETLLSFENWDVEDTIDDPHTGKIVGAYYNGEDGLTYVYFDEVYRRLQRMIDKALPQSVNWLTSRTLDGNRYTVFSYSDIDSGSYYLFDVPSKQLIYLESNYEGLDPRLLSPLKKVSYQARDGLTIHGYLTVPLGSDGKNLPTVILPHGGPTSRDYWRYDYLVQFLASRGYAVLQPNFRGSTGYGKEFEEAGRRQWGLKMQDDITDAALWLVAEGVADPERMCIFGWSYGGYAALTAAFTTPDLFKCSISINGISDLLKLVAEESGYLAVKEWGELIGDPNTDREKLKNTSAYYNVDKIKMPILMIATKDDTTVNYEQSKQLHKRLQDRGKFSMYIEIEDGNHSARNEPAQMIILENLENFLRRHIGPGR